jgi:hypothetical protein
MTRHGDSSGYFPVDAGDLRRAWDCRTLCLDCDNVLEKGPLIVSQLETVLKEIEKYEHPFFDFAAREKDEGIELCIRSKIPNVLSPEYRITFAERDINSTQFPWTFQRLLYGCLTDYVVELFTKSPMTR